MKLTTSTTFFLMLLSALLLPAAHAQNGSQMGIGVGVNASSTGIYFPILMPPALLIEPTIALVHLSSKNDDFDVKASDIALRVGTGLFSTSSIDDNTNMYFGGRIGIMFNKEKISAGSNTESESSIDFFVGPAIGGEHFLGDHFSLGAESGLTITFFGNEDSDSNLRARTISTYSTFFVRAYLK